MIILKNAKIVLENKIIEKGYLKISNDKIIAIGEGSIAGGIDLKGQWILPGFIDCHVHGGYGVDFETGNADRFAYFAKNIVKEGVTSYVQGSISNSIVSNNKYMHEFQQFMVTTYQGAKCLGIHLEGPFISKTKKGAHNLKLLLKPDIKILKKWQELSGNNIRIITYAPEEQDGSFTKYLIKNNIIASAGHSNMMAQEFEKDYNLGLNHITHLFNAMTGVDHKNPGLATAALNHENVLVEVISDGIHIKPEVLKLIYDHKTANNICIITDAMNAKGMADGDYFLGKLPVTKHGMKVVLKDSDTLAASAATYDYNVREYQRLCNIEMTALIKMTSINIAKQLNIFAKTGSITIGKQADLVILGQDLTVKKTIVNGKIVFEE